MKGCVIDFINFPTFSKSKTNNLSNTIPNSDLILKKLKNTTAKWQNVPWDFVRIIDEKTQH